MNLLTKCPYCKKEISNQSKQCIHCGVKIKKIDKYQIIIDKYFDTDISTIASLNIIFHGNLSYYEGMEILKDCPYHITDCDTYEEAINLKNELLQFDIEANIISPGLIIDDDDIQYKKNMNVMFCKHCREIMQKPFNGYMSFCDKDDLCPFCKEELEQINFYSDDFNFLRNKVSKDINFLESMIKLRQENIIEYQMKLSQFKSQIGQQESSRIQNDTRPKCPHCNSTNISQISTTERVGSIAMWGIFSKKINKSFKCKSCGYTW